MAERVGFEPTIPITQDNVFRARRLQPLGHLSAFRFFRFPAKNSLRMSPHSSARRPPLNSGRWLSFSKGNLITDRTAPAFGSGAPKTTFLIRACTTAPMHMGQGSRVT